MQNLQPFYVKTSNTQNQRRLTTMIYYLFPRCNLNITLHCKCSFLESKPCKYYSYSLNSFLQEIEVSTNEIDNWKEIRHLANPYRLLPSLFSSKYCNNKTDEIYFVFFEIIEICNIMNFKWKDISVLRCLHFDERTLQPLNFLNKRSKHTTCKWNSLFSNETYMSYSKQHFNLVLCSAYRETEYENALSLILQICIAITTSKKGSDCIIKYSDSFEKLSLDIFTFVSHFYEKTFFMKPSVCNLTNSEKYIVCSNYIYSQISEKSKDTLHQLYKEVVYLHNNPNKFLSRILSQDIPMFIWSKFE